LSNAPLPITAALAIALLPAFHVARLPFRFEWRYFLMDYWVLIAIESVFLAILLFAVGRTKELFLILSTKGPKAGLRALCSRYLLLLRLSTGHLLQDVIATTLFDGSGDALLATADSFLLAGHSYEC